MKPLNFNKIEKKYLTVTLADEKSTTIMIGTPTKAMMDDLIRLNRAIDKVEDTEELYKSCAKLMSRNKGGIVITAQFLEELFDFEDITIFVNAYMDFLEEVTNSKN